MSTLKKKKTQTSLLFQWLRSHLPMQEVQVQSLVWEDSTRWEGTKPMKPQLLSPCSTREAPAVRGPHTETRENPHIATKTQHSPK